MMTLDFRMPRMMGLDLIKALKREPISVPI